MDGPQHIRSTPAAAEAAVVVQGLHVRRGRLHVLRNLDFTVASGSITGLLGPSGSGKTTLMRVIMGLQRFGSGTVTVLGSPAGAAPLRRKLGYMTQSPSVYRDLTVLDNVRYFATLHGRSAAEARDAVDAVGLTGESRRLTADLSGGQFNRVSLACALVGDPELLIMDEPTVGLDPVLRAELWAHFRRLADAGATLLVSSHVMEEARHCQDLLLLRDGRLLAQLTPEELAARGHNTDLEQAFLAMIQESGASGPGQEEAAS
ncbi:ABC transporter ATP-binding protein [Arthrobacter woluwensis]|uniref:ABC transporter ATP-binding protein n=1 Tax=Arthrobacter woluwensis TaxID=156980 RepID=UPI001AAEC26D|nr:ABC transporter ATP-binding protein [Arthrobacter woluwensis]QTF71011.1 ABC transporter ATP-binding protein [Arthrobacter woluwensis]